jgi:hypothetical protein
MKRAPLLSAVLIAVLGGACSSAGDNPDAGPSTDPSESVTTDSETVSPTPSPTITTPTGAAAPPESGDAIRQDTQATAVGEAVGAVVSSDGVPSVQLVVNELAVDGECTSALAVPSERGHMLVVSLTMSTNTELVDVTLTPTVDVSRLDFRIVGPDGLVEADNGTMPAYACLAESDAMPPEVGPGQTVTGKIAFDTEHTAGVLVYRPWWVDTAGGWEWAF